MALLGTVEQNENVGIKKLTVEDAGDDTNMIITVEYYWYDGLTLVSRVEDFSTPYAQTPGEINDDIVGVVNQAYDDAHP